MLLHVGWFPIDRSTFLLIYRWWRNQTKRYSRYLKVERKSYLISILWVQLGPVNGVCAPKNVKKKRYSLDIVRYRSLKIVRTRFLLLEIPYSWTRQSCRMRSGFFIHLLLFLERRWARNPSKKRSTRRAMFYTTNLFRHTYLMNYQFEVERV